jgi:16S rRNA (cytosine1402-N4)-methyltransferase
MSQDRDVHRPVMADEVVELLRRLPPGVVVDATYGGGGHARRLVQELGVRILGIDRDPAAVAQGPQKGQSVTVVQGNFADLISIVERTGMGRPAAVLFDFGVSSLHLDEPERGFSFRHRGPLDMRMDPAGDRNAADLINEAPVGELAAVLRRFGEEPAAARIARAIVAARPIRDTIHLAEVVAGTLAYQRRGHPARRTFQAVRIWVNRELEAIEQGVDAAIQVLPEGGRLVAISYHSLEDRIIKRRLAVGSQGCVCPPDLPVCGCGKAAELAVLTRRALRPRPEEVTSNPRARSARLRAAEKVAA